MKEFAEDNFPEFDDETLNSHDSDASNTNNQKSDTYIASDENKKSQNENKPHVSFDMFLKGNDWLEKDSCACSFSFSPIIILR